MNVFLIFSFLLYTINAQSYSEIDKLIRNIENISKNKIVSTNSDAGLNITQFLEKYNYPVENHTVETDDDFVLTLHRIRHGRNETDVTETSRPIVILVHGLLCSAMDWIFMGPEKSLGLILADTGYDVWLVNTRGSRYSMEHKRFNESTPEFWDYDWHEKGYYDLAAIIDYVTVYRNEPKITLVGHSEGTSASMVLTSKKTIYNDKINLMVFLSPIAYMDEVTSPIVLLMVKYMEVLELLTKVLNIYGIPYIPDLNNAAIALCSDDSPFQQLCANLVEILVGYDYGQLDKSFLSVLVTSSPAGISVKELVHYGQEIRTGKFREYDYGWANILHYESKDPPEYNLSRITAPVEAFYSQNDFFAGVNNVEKLIKELPDARGNLIKEEYFNHYDFIIAKDAKKILYDDVVKIINKYNNM